MNKKDY